MPTIRGKITDSNGQPAERIIRLYRRDTGALLGTTTSAYGSSSDPLFQNVSLLLPCNQLSGSTTPVDVGPRPKPVYALGAAAISTSEYKFGRASLSTPSVGSYLSVSPDQDLVFGSGDFTVEAWLRTTATGEKTLVDQYITGTPSWQFAVFNGKLSWYEGRASGGTRVLMGATTVTDGTWHHIAATRQSGVLRLFVDGVLDATSSPTATSNYASAIPTGICAQVYARNSNYDLIGHMDDIRITKGAARYTATFAPITSEMPTSGEASALGDYSLTTSYVGEVQRVVLDDDGGELLNDLIDRVNLA